MTFNYNGTPQDLIYTTNSTLLDSAYDTFGKIVFSDREVVFEDNFNSIDTSKWDFRSGYYSERYYMPDDYSNNAYIDNGMLVIRNIRDNPVPDRAWSGAFIETRGKYYFKYGVVESRIKFPTDSLKYHATLWLMGENYDSDGWPKCGEIDLAEADDGSLSASLHYLNKKGTHSSFVIGEITDIDISEWHVYKMIWTEEMISIYVDDRLLGNAELHFYTDNDGYNAFRQPMFVMFNCNPYGLHDEDNYESNTVTCYIDYIKISQ